MPSQAGRPFEPGHAASLPKARKRSTCDLELHYPAIPAQRAGLADVLVLLELKRDQPCRAARLDMRVVTASAPGRADGQTTLVPRQLRRPLPTSRDGLVSSRP